MHVRPQRTCLHGGWVKLRSCEHNRHHHAPPHSPCRHAVQRVCSPAGYTCTDGCNVVRVSLWKRICDVGALVLRITHPRDDVVCSNCKSQHPTANQATTSASADSRQQTSKRMGENHCVSRLVSREHVYVYREAIRRQHTCLHGGWVPCC